MWWGLSEFLQSLIRNRRGELMLTKKTLLVVLCALVCLLSSQVFGQANGSFSGTIADKTGSVITGATVKITSQSTGISRDGKTDDTGHYLIPLHPVSLYTIHVEASGFQ